jgi:hypothetical protein
MENKIEIWSPRYKDDVCLIGQKHIITGDNYIWFSKAKHLIGKMYKIHSNEIVKYPLQQNGRMPVYQVPMNKLELVQNNSGQTTSEKESNVVNNTAIIQSKTQLKTFDAKQIIGLLKNNKIDFANSSDYLSLIDEFKKQIKIIQKTTTLLHEKYQLKSLNKLFKRPKS